MANNKLELVFILDRSGSMGGLESDTIGGFNSMLEKQKNEEGQVIVTTVLFDNRYELLHDRIDIRAISPITEKEYYVRGNTALLDAIGYTIDKIGNVQKVSAPDMRADKVLFVITTDGMENSSHNFTASDIRYMIERQRERYGWEFIFLGANIDAIATARHYGIDPDRAARYHSDKLGTQFNYDAINKAVSDLRSKDEIDKDWKSGIDADFKKRKQ